MSDGKRGENVRSQVSYRRAPINPLTGNLTHGGIFKQAARAAHFY